MPSTAGEDFKLSDHEGKYVVLYFYPKDSTPGCTLEGQEFTQLLKNFHRLGAEVFGVSRDSLKSHTNFKTKQCYDFELLSDQDEKLCEIFDVIKEKNMYGKKVMGIERSTFIIGPDRKLLQEWRKVKVTGHAAEVLEAIKGFVK